MSPSNTANFIATKTEAEAEAEAAAVAVVDGLVVVSGVLNAVSRGCALD